MAEGLVKVFLQRLNSLLVQESETFAGLEEQIKWLMATLGEVGCFFENIGSTEGDAAVCSWVKELGAFINDTDDRIDEFVVTQVNNQNESDRTALTDRFNMELEKMNSCLDEIVGKMGELDNSTIIEGKKDEENKESEGTDEGETSASSSSPVQTSYIKLPYYLQTCLMYCCIFPENDWHHWISRGRLTRLLLAEGLIQEKAGKVMEDIGEENINELIRLGMLQEVGEYPNSGSKITVPSTYREFLFHKMKEQNFVTACKDSTSSIPKSTCRVSLHSDMMSVTSKLENLRLRSLFVFANQGFSGEESNWLNFNGAQFLRVLDLEGTKIKSLPEEVGDLIHLRYLGLKETNISELPQRLGNLRALQTLDIRWCGYLTGLPEGILNLVQLRHLKMFKNFGICGMKVIEGIGGHRNLLTLTGIHPGGSTARELGNLIQLRTLGVMDVTNEDVSELFASIMKMPELLRLTLKAKQHYFDQGELALLETFSPPPLIKKLQLEGLLKQVPNWLGSMKRLTKLRLGYSHLFENPSLVLQLLPNLKDLTLWHAYKAKKIEKEFCRVGGFPKLEYLCIASDVLEEWTVLEEGALPNLKHLHLHSCLQLRMLPEGLQFVTTLEQLDLLPLLDDHAERLKPDGGQENHKIKHIPLVRFMTTSMIRQLVNTEIHE